MKYWLSVLALCLCAGHAVAEQQFGTAFPGGIAVIDLGPIAGDAVPQAHYKGRPVAVIADSSNQQWQAWVGLSLGTSPGLYHLLVGEQKIAFTVADRKYKEQHITLKNKRHVNPAPMDLERIGRERKLMDRAFEAFDTSRPALMRMRLPADGPTSSPFGLRRFFNGQARKPHSGLDIAAPRGAPIIAPAPGIVTLTGNYFFNGNTVLLDHGQGLISMFCHLDEILVEEGTQLGTGALLGRVGSTGRATGPHLHWSLSLNDARIDPTLLLKAE